MEVRFADEAAMKRQVRTAVRDALLDAGLVRSSAPRGRSKPAEAEVAPTTADDLGAADPDADDPDAPDPDVDDAAVEVDGTAVEADDADAERVAPDASSPVDDGTARDESDGATRDRSDATGATPNASPSSPAKQSDTASTQSDTTSSRSSSASSPAGSEHASAGGSRSGAADERFGGGLEQRTLTGEEATPEGEYDRLPSMRVLGQYRDTYLVAETNDGLVLVDQHAADERVNYERLREAFEGDATAQALAEPVTLEVTAGEAEAFPAYREALATLGFHAERTDDVDESSGAAAGSAREVTVTTVPAVFGETLDPADVRDVLSGFVASDDDGAATVDALADAFVADLACYPSVTANTSLTEGSVVELLEALDDCENPFACPHGRPTVVRLDHDDLADRFERDYPGHGGRREL